MTPQTFNYQGHMVTIAPQDTPKGVQYWFIVDDRPITYSSNADTSKRLATRFIDVVNDSVFKTSRQQPMYTIGRA